MAEPVRVMLLGSSGGVLEEHLEAAYLLGFGIRLTNERARQGPVSWVLELYAEEWFVPLDAAVRAWPLPPGVAVVRTWSGGAVAEAVGLAREASAQGRWVRVHTVLRGDGPDESAGGATSVCVVDVFDAPVPVEPDEDG